jgi:hypothetical protein
LTATLLGTTLAAIGCSSDQSHGAASDAGPKGDTGPSKCTGAPETASSPDSHCVLADGGVKRQAVGVCEPESSASADAGAPDYGATMQGTEGDDDDCKYHVKFTVPPICATEGVTFRLTLTRRTDGTPVDGADPQIEATTADFASVAESPGTSTPVAGSPGVYDIGPVKFGSAGKWIVRFHLFDTCADSETSPHGHAAFFVDIP